MKKRTIIAMTALLVSAAVLVSAEDLRVRSLCNISAQTCQNLVDNLQKRIMKINEEIKKGNKSYSADDMKMLEQKLKAAMEQLDKIEAGIPK